HRLWMLEAGTTTFEGKSGYGLDRDTELASLRAIRDAGGVPTWLGAHSVPPEFDDADAYLDFALTEVLPDAAKLAEAADVFLGRCDRARDRLQSRQRVLREPAARLLARRDPTRAHACGGAVRVHGQCGARARPRRSPWPPRSGLRRRHRPARRARLAVSRVPP